MIGQVLGCDDLEFAWGDRTAPDPQTQATIAAAYVGAGIKTRNEVRVELGLDPIAGGDALTTATPAAPLPEAMAKAGYRDDETRQHGEWATDAADRTRGHLIDGVADPYIFADTLQKKGNYGINKERDMNGNAVPDPDFVKHVANTIIGLRGLIGQEAGRK